MEWDKSYEGILNKTPYELYLEEQLQKAQYQVRRLESEAGRFRPLNISTINTPLMMNLEDDIIRMHKEAIAGWYYDPSLESYCVFAKGLMGKDRPALVHLISRRAIDDQREPHQIINLLGAMLKQIMYDLAQFLGKKLAEEEEKRGPNKA